MIVVITPEAEADLAEATDWLRNQSPALPARFERVVADAISAAQEHPHAHPSLQQEIRRVLTRIFPYGVFYIVEEDRIVVVAVVHQARHPSTWRRRL